MYRKSKEIKLLVKQYQAKLLPEIERIEAVINSLNDQEGFPHLKVGLFLGSNELSMARHNRQFGQLLINIDFLARISSADSSDFLKSETPRRTGSRLFLAQDLANSVEHERTHF